MKGLKKAAPWLVPAAVALWVWTPLSAFVQGHRTIIDYAYAEQGEALLHAAHRAAFDVSYHLPLGPIVEGLLLAHAGPGAGGAGVLVLCVLGLGLLFAIGGMLGPVWGGWLFVAAGARWAAGLPADSTYKTFLCTFFVLLAVAAMVYRARNPSLKADLMLALALGSSLLLRSFLVFLPPLIVVYDWLSPRRAPDKRGWRGAAVLCLVPYLFLLPWARLNWHVHHRFIPFEHGEADIAIASGAVGLVEGAEGDVFALIDARLGPQDSVLPWALTQVARHPARYVMGFLGRLLFVLKLFPFLLIAAALAVWLRRDREEFRQAGLFCAYFILVHCLFVAGATFFLPLRPILAGLASTLLLAPLRLKEDRKESPCSRACARLLAAGLLAALALSAVCVRVVDLYAAAIARRPASSAAAIEEGLAAHPDDPWLLRQSGLAALRQGDAAGAASALGRARSLAPDLPGIERDVDLALAFAPEGDAAPLLALGEPDSPFPNQDDRVPRLYKAAALLRLGRRNEALAELESAVSLARRASWVRDAPSPETRTLAQIMRGEAATRMVEHLDELPLPDADRLALAQEVLRAHGAEEPSLSAAVAALAAEPARSAEPEAERNRKYFYEDIQEPFFVPDDERPGFYKTARPGASSASFARRKPEGTYRVFVIGGSIARLFMSGETDQSLAEALGAAMPSKKIEAIDCGMPGYDSYREAGIVREALDLSPDLIVLMTGHNETLGAPPAPLWLLRIQTLLRSWGLILSNKRRDDVAAALESNLRQELRQAARRGVRAAVIVPPLNYRDTPAESWTSSGAAFAVGWFQYLRGDFRAAAASFKKDGGSLALYYLARCQDRLGLREQARASFLKSVAADRWTARCGPGCQDTIRRAAAEQGAAVADVDAAFIREARAEPDGLPGLSLFSDGVHWRPRYNHLVVSTILDALKLGPVPAPRPYSPDPETEALRTLRYALADAQSASGQRLSAGRLSQRSLAEMDWVYARYPGWFSDIPSLIRRAKENATPRGKAWGMAPLDPPPAAVCLHAGVMLLARRQTAAAAILFERALAAAPDDPTAALYAGLASALSGRKAQASERLSAALRRAGDEKDREFLSQDANVIAELFGLSPIAEAAPDSEAAGALAEAQTLVRQNRPEAARASLEKAQGLRARQETLLNIAKLWLSMKDYRRSSEVIERLMRENPRDPEYPMAAAEAALGAGRRDSALRSLALARGLSPSDDQQRRLSFLYQQAGDFGHALEILRALAQRRPADAGVLKDKGICEYQDGLLDAAAESLKAAISLDPGLLEAYLSLGTLYSGQGRRDQALAVYDQALARTPRPDQAAVRPLIVQSRADLR